MFTLCLRGFSSYLASTVQKQLKSIGVSELTECGLCNGWFVPAYIMLYYYLSVPT